MECIIGVLSVLVTALIGWQIFLLIDLKQMQKEVKEEKLRIFFESDKNMSSISFTMSDFYYTQLSDISEDQKVFKYINYRVHSIYHANKAKIYDVCSQDVKFLLETIKPTTTVSTVNKKHLIESLKMVANAKHIDKFHELIVVISQLKTLD